MENGNKNKRRREVTEEQSEAKRQKAESSDQQGREDAADTPSQIYDEENVNRIKQVRRAKAKEEKFRYFETEGTKNARCTWRRNGRESL